MKIEYLVNQAKKYLPILSDNFTKNIKVKSLKVENGLFTLKLEEPINLRIGDEGVLFVKNIPLKIEIESIAKTYKNSNEAILTCKQNHNISKDPNDLKKQYIRIFDCASEEYNKDIEVLSDFQDGGFKLKIKVDYLDTDNPDVSNAYFYIFKQQTSFGIKKIKVEKEDEITFQDDDTTLNYEVDEFEDMKIMISTRIYPAYDFEDVKAQFTRNIQKDVKYDKALNKDKVEIKIKQQQDYTSYIVLNSDITNEASNPTSVGLHKYSFSIFTFMPHRDGNKYLVRNEQDILVNNIFNKIFAEKTITLTDNSLIVNKTNKIYFIKCNMAEQRFNDYSIFEIQYSFTINTYTDDYKLPLYDIRLNEIDLSLTNRESSNFSDLKILC